MKYRTFKRTGIKISEISLGAEHIEKAPYNEVKSIIDIALDHGVNYADLFMASPDIRDHFGKALSGKRDKMMIAGHLGAAYIDNQYARIRDMELIKQFYSDLLKRLSTDYIDMLMLHYIDELEDLEKCLDIGMLDYALEQKKKGAARMIGISTHVPAVAIKAIKTGQIDAVMFSVNPMFDLMSAEKGIYQLFGDHETLKGEISMDNERHRLYAACEKQNIGVISMKTFAGGWLLSPDSPIKMTANQLINYALSQPGVVSACLGCMSADEYAGSLKYMEASNQEKDFTEPLISTLKWTGIPQCLYCNHCLPCPQGIDIAGAMRIIDAGGECPDNCTGCRSCEKRCPFGVHVVEKFHR